MSSIHPTSQVQTVTSNSTRPASSPVDVAYRYTTIIAEVACIRMYMQWKLFDQIPETGDIPYAELAQTIGGSEELVSRMGNMLVSTGKLGRPRPGRVAHTEESLMFRTGGPGGTLFRVFFDEQYKGWVRWPDYFAKYGPGVPKGDRVNPKCFAEGVDGEMSYFDCISAGGAERVDVFADAMKALEQLLPVAGIYDFSWVGEHARAEPDSDRPLIVDVGASKGHILRIFLEENPAIIPSRCVMEDRADVIEEAEQSSAGDPILSRVQKVATDFCGDQPVKGALVYYLRQVIHDYSDDVCVDILRHIVAAMVDDPRARVLICEQILPDTPAPIPYTMDMLMLNLGSRERTEGDFQRLAKAAGLKVVKVHRGKDTTVGVVECAMGSSG